MDEINLIAGRVGAVLRRAVSPASAPTLFAGAVATGALVVLAARSARRLDTSFDTFWYHVPFAALRGGLSIPYEMSEGLQVRFQGFPPLPDLAQGLLWRFSGSLNAIGVVNFLAFAFFLAYCHRVLRAPFWLVALISLTAPLVLIHMAVGYVDLFGNAFVTIGLSSCLALHLFPERPSRAVAVGGLAALAAAAWSKYLLVPIVGVAFVLLAVLLARSRAPDRFRRRQAAAVILIFAALAAAPYAKNLAVYHNPFWPDRVPIVAGLFPYLEDGAADASQQQRPADLRSAPQAQVFIESLFETRNPTAYPNRLRWVVDQGDLPPSAASFRMGGFWWVGVVTYLLIAFGLLLVYQRKAGVVAVIAGIGLLGFVAVLPQSNELRYYMFIPLTWAATIGMLFPMLRARSPRIAVGLIALVLVLFGSMVSENSAHYRYGKLDYHDAAVQLGAADWWPKLQPGKTYCVVNVAPIGIMLTGPTMHEFSIVERRQVSACPAGTIVVTQEGLQAPATP